MSSCRSPKTDIKITDQSNGFESISLGKNDIVEVYDYSLEFKKLDEYQKACWEVWSISNSDHRIHAILRRKANNQ